MTTRFKTSLAAALAVLMMAEAAAVLMAQEAPQRRQRPGIGAPGGRGMRGPGAPLAGGFGLGPGFGSLDLSDDQKEQLKRIAGNYRDEVRAAHDKIGAARQGMRALIEADAVDEGAIRAKSAEVAAAEADLLILQARIRKESMQVLTADQLAKLKETRDRRVRRRAQ